MKKFLLAVMFLGLAMSNYMDQLYVGDKAQINGGFALGGYAVISQNSGTTYNVAQNLSAVILKNAQTIATFSIVLPIYPDDGQIVVIDPVSAVTSINLTAGKTTDSISPSITSLTAATTIKLIYTKIAGVWYKW